MEMITHIPDRAETHYTPVNTPYFERSPDRLRRSLQTTRHL